MCKTIKQMVKFKAPPKLIYKLLTDSKMHAAFTGESAKISRRVGGKVSAYSGYITAINVDLRPSKQVVLAWRCGDFPTGVFTMAVFALSRTKDGGTELVLTHRGVPKQIIPQTEAGWKKYYWRRIKHYLKE